MVHVLVAEEQLAALEQALQNMQDLTVQIARGTSDAPVLTSLDLEVVGSDRPGIVQQVARALAAQGANVEELFTEVQSAPMSGEVMFHAYIKVGLPEGLNADQLGEALESLSDDIMVTIVD
jgi:glycine cleavage system regulatory protein